jgi:hypothetical protein
MSVWLLRSDASRRREEDVVGAEHDGSAVRHLEVGAAGVTYEPAPRDRMTSARAFHNSRGIGWTWLSSLPRW